MPLTEGWELNNTTNILGGVCFPCGLSGFDEASSFLYRFVTDVAGELRIDWSWVKSGTTTFGLLGPILLLNGTHIRTADNPSGFVIRQLAANTEYEIRFASRSNRFGGVSSGEGEITTTLRFAIPASARRFPSPGTALLVILGLAGVATIGHAKRSHANRSDAV